ncbi:MAG: Na/Pi symporter [Candidatus Glassbacteria bacterium]|nr:Na/Pi symporter [Candidatus Glassbacteria bacterium]
MVADSNDVSLRRTLLNIILFLVFLYFFLLSIQVMAHGFKALGGAAAKNFLRPTENPFVGLFIGILATSLFQSSSSTTSIVVGLVAVGALTLNQAIPMVMGANIGTTVTNTIVSLGHISRKDDFRRAFAAALLHDIFNLLSVAIVFPLWMFTHYLDRAAEFLSSAFSGAGGVSFSSPLKMITQPVADQIGGLLGETGWLILLVSLVLLFVSLRYMVLYMKALVMTRAEVIFERTVFRTDFHGLLFGMVLTALVQSSSVTTSLMVPLAGAGMITLPRLFPYVLGANIGTTVTAMLAALATGNATAISVAFAHLLFNISGILIFWWIKCVPIKLTQHLSNFITKHRALAIVYIALVFFIIPFTLIYLLE